MIDDVIAICVLLVVFGLRNLAWYCAHIYREVVIWQQNLLSCAHVYKMVYANWKYLISDEIWMKMYYIQETWLYCT
jgi:hypothetical protein